MTRLAVLGSALEQTASRCIHCGLCLEDCPTYLELGNEMDSPRGRILLMRGLAAGEISAGPVVAEHLERCLDCRACEAVCPSGVRYSELIETVRGALSAREDAGVPDRVQQWMLRGVLPYRSWLRLGLRLFRAARRSRWMDSARRRAAWLGRWIAVAEHAEPPADRTLHRSTFEPPLRARVSLFTGCATAEMTPRTFAMVRQVLEVNGCVAACDAGQGCCGALHAHAGDFDGARRLAAVNLAVFADEQPIVTFAAGCGAMLKEYPRLFSEDAQRCDAARRFAARVQDVSEFLQSLGPRAPTHALPLRVTYHDACHHAHAQGVRTAPRELLRLIPGLTLIESDESAMCCGAAGSYNLTQPEIAARLAVRKLGHLRESGAEAAATGNIGCILHLRSRSGGALRVVHFVELLHAAYGLGAPPGDSRG